MKFLKPLALLLFLCIVFSSYAQKVTYKGNTYLVKGKIIFLNDVDITNTLSYEDQVHIKNELSAQLLAEKKQKAVEKAQKKTEKAQKKAEKKQKKAEKELKKQAKNKASYIAAQKKYEKALKKYQKLKEKNKLIPADIPKWESKLKSLQERIDKLKKKL